jgi:hypothetical protein
MQHVESTFSVKNFEKFQHYKDRSPPWIKLYNELLENYEFGQLPDTLKGQLIGIWLLASRLDNKLPYDPTWIRSKINATSPVDLDALQEAGFIHSYDPQKANGKLENWPSRYIPEVVRASAFKRDGNKCIRCEATKRLEVDHIVPISQGGTADLDNLQILCVSCNRRKRAEQMRSKPNADAEQMRSNVRSMSCDRRSREREGET